VGLSDDNAIAITQTGRFVLRVENAMLVVYEWSGSGMSMTWQRRCQLAAPDGYIFRTSKAGGRVAGCAVSSRSYAVCCVTVVAVLG
jgi:hypothetical protein